MRALCLAIIVLSAMSGVATAADKAPKKVTEKVLIGKWTIKTVGAGKDTFKKSIEFKADKTYVWMILSSKNEGTYLLKGNTLFLKKKGSRFSTIWKNLSLKDGKIIQPLTTTLYNELTRVKEKP